MIDSPRPVCWGGPLCGRPAPRAFLRHWGGIGFPWPRGWYFLSDGDVYRWCQTAAFGPGDEGEWRRVLELAIREEAA